MRGCRVACLRVAYEYEDIGLPFLRAPGQVIDEIEPEREREFAPELSRFRLSE